MVSSVLLGRGHEIALLRGALERVERGEACAVIVAGDPGVGKTALIRTFLRESKRVLAIASAECLEIESALPYAPFRVILERLTSIRPAAGETVAQVRGLLSTVADSRLAMTERSQIDTAWARLVSVAAADHPIVIVVEDLHWADDASIELLLYLARKLVQSPVLLLTSLRPSEPDPLRRVERFRLELERRVNAVEITVGPLPRSATSALIRVLLELDGPPDRDFAERLHERSGGNPLLTEEILRDLIDRGMVLRSEGAWHRREPLWDEVAPPSVASTVGARLESLPTDTRDVLTAAAVLGQRFAYHTLLAFTGRSADSVIDGLKAGIAAQLIEEEPGSDGSYRFRHALLRDAIEDRLLIPERQALHQTAAEVLEGHASRAELATHYALAGDTQRETAHRVEAALEAMRTVSYSDALRHGERLLEVAPPGVIRDDFFIRLMPAVQEIGNLERAVRFAEKSRDFYARQADEILRGRCVAWSGTLYAARGEWDRHVASQFEAIAVLEPFGDTIHLANALANLSEGRSDAREALALAERCLAIAVRLGAVREQLRGLFFVGRALLRLGRTEEGVAFIRRSAEVARRATPEELARSAAINHIEFASIVLAWVPGMVHERRALSEESLALARKHGARHAFVIRIEDRWALQAGQWDDCVRHAEELRSFQSGSTFMAGLEVRDKWMRWMRQGGTGTERDELERARRRALAQGVWQPASLWPTALAIAEGDPRRALASAELAWDRLDSDIANAAGVYALAAARLLGDWASFDRWSKPSVEGPSEAPAVRGRLEFAAAERAIEQGEVAVGLAALTTSADHFLDFGEPIVELFIRQRRIEVLAGYGQAELASAELASLVRYWRTAKAHWYLDRLRQQLTPLGLEFAEERATKTKRGSPGGLTRREREVALLVAEGLTDKEIAERLGLSRRTAESHVERIRAKLGFTSRAQIAKWVGERTRAN